MALIRCRRFSRKPRRTAGDRYTNPRLNATASWVTLPRAEPSLFGVALVVEGHMTHPDPNQCPCTTGRDSFDGLTLLELGDRCPNYDTAVTCLEDNCCRADLVALRHRPDPRSSLDEDGHLEADDWYRRNSEGAP